MCRSWNADETTLCTFYEITNFSQFSESFGPVYFIFVWIIWIRTELYIAVTMTKNLQKKIFPDKNSKE